MPAAPRVLFALILATATIALAQNSTLASGQPTASIYSVPPCDRQTTDVLTHRNNSFRTGANLNEICLTADNVKKSFGKLFTLPVRGQVYAQPLVVTGLSINNEFRHTVEDRKNVVFVATMENWVYAFDAEGGNRDPNGIPQPFWSKPLGPPLPVNRIPKDIGAFLGKYNIEPFVGITSTPVIDPQRETMFLVAKIAKIVRQEVDCDKEVATRECPVENRIFALSLRTGEESDSRGVDLPSPEMEQIGKPCSPLLDPRETSPWDAARINMQRAALLFTRGPNDSVGHIYLGFGSHQDAPCPMYHGMLIRFDYDRSAQKPAHKLSQFPDKFLVSKLGETDPGTNLDPKNLGKGGIWQAGNGPGADHDGNVFVMTGNGSFEQGVQYGSNFVKLSPDLSKIDWFAPWNVDLLNADSLDIDLGSSGPVLLPGTDQVVGGGKQGKLYLLKRSSLGHLQKWGWPHAHTDPPIQYFWAARRWASEFIYGWFPISLFAFATGYHHIHGAPAFWGDPDEPNPQSVLQRSLYVWPERDNLKAFAYKKDSADKDGKFIPKPKAFGPMAGRGMPGGFLSISANGLKEGTGILWAALPLHDDAWIDIVRGALRAFSISVDGTRIEPIWTSYCADKGDKFDFAKYVPPTVANGRVYLATFSGFVSVYGIRSGSQPPPDAPPDCKVSDLLKGPSYRSTHRAAQGRRH